MRDLKDIRNYYKRTKAHDMRDEIFQESPEYKHYCLGWAQGVTNIIDFINEHKDSVSLDHLLTGFSSHISNEDGLLSEYFNRLKNEE